jgi:DNA-binding CsgD family transcriptional regulator
MSGSKPDINVEEANSENFQASMACPAEPEPSHSAARQLIELALALVEGIAGLCPECPMILLNSDRAVLATNPEGERVLAEGVALRLVDGRLSGNGGFGGALEEALASIAAGLTTIRFGHDPEAKDAGFTAYRMPDSAQLSGATLLVLKRADSLLPSIVVRHRLRERYGLSPAEAALLWHLHQTEGLRQAADAMGISIGNARTKLKRVMVKTGARSQQALMLLVERKLQGLRAG